MTPEEHDNITKRVQELENLLNDYQVAVDDRKGLFRGIAWSIGILFTVALGILFIVKYFHG